MQTQPNFQQYKGAQNDRCSNIVKVHKGIERQNTNRTVNETGYHDHDMQKKYSIRTLRTDIIKHSTRDMNMGKNFKMK